jgi:hypothetical protein
VAAGLRIASTLAPDLTPAPIPVAGVAWIVGFLGLCRSPRSVLAAPRLMEIKVTLRTFLYLGWRGRHSAPGWRDAACTSTF